MKLAALAFCSLIFVVLAAHAVPPNGSSELKTTLSDVSKAYAELEPQSIRPAEGFIKYDYLIPAGYYKQMWDWDGFFIGVHLANQSRDKAKYLKFWVLDFAGAIDKDGYVAGCITTKGPRPLMGKFAMKPFLAQGAVIASRRLGDFTWVKPIWQDLRKVIAYREKTQYDPKWRLFFWDNAMQSGADNNVALTNDPKDRSAILAADLCTFQLREYEAMVVLAANVGDPGAAKEFREKASRLRAAMREHLWFEQDAMFFNIRRDNGQPLKRVSYSNFVPLIEDVVSDDRAKRMVRRYLLNPDQMKSKFGLRSLSKEDPDYNNVRMIDPYSNWQGPVWINANYLHYVALKKHGFQREAEELATTLGRMMVADIEKWHSMHENYNAETGEGLAPTPEQSPNHVFTGFVGWNLLVEDMLECEANNKCELLGITP